MRKWQMLAASKVKMSGSEKKKWNVRTYDFSSTKRTTRKFHLRWSRAKQGKEMYKNCAARANFFFRS